MLASISINASIIVKVAIGIIFNSQVVILLLLKAMSIAEVGHRCQWPHICSQTLASHFPMKVFTQGREKMEED
jgi:hypothetical protein